MSLTTIVATLAPILNCCQMLPQIYKTYKTKKVTDLSFQALFLLLLTSVLWTLHGIFIADNSLIIAGIVSIIINILLLLLYFCYRRR